MGIGATGLAVIPTLGHGCGQRPGIVDHGVVGGRQLSVQMSQDPPCTGAFFGDAWINENDELVGRYQGRACQGDLTAELTGTRG